MDFMDRCKKPLVHCIAYEVVQIDEPAINTSLPIFKQRKYWVKNINYNKIILSQVPLEWNAGQHQIEAVEGDESKLFLNEGLYLLHLKHIGLGERFLGPFTSKSGQGFKMEDKKLIPEWIKEAL